MNPARKDSFFGADNIRCYTMFVLLPPEAYGS